MTDFKEGERLFRGIVQQISLFYGKKPEHFIPRGSGWTHRRRIEYAEKKLAEHWDSLKLVGEVSNEMANLCRLLDDIQTKIDGSVLAPNKRGVAG